MGIQTLPPPMSNIKTTFFFPPPMHVKSFEHFRLPTLASKDNEFHEMLRPACSGPAEDPALPTHTTSKPTPLTFNSTKCFILPLHIEQTFPS